MPIQSLLAEVASAKKETRTLRRGALALCVVACSSLSIAHAEVAITRCVNDAAQRFDLRPEILRAILEVESSGRCVKRHPTNKNGSYDIGCMGINTSWLPLLERKFGINEQDLYDPCTNIHVGAWVLAKNKRTFGDHWRAVGAYNAISEPKRINYAWKVNAKLGQLQR